MAPVTRIDLCLAGFKLVVSVKGLVVLLFVAAKTKRQGVRYRSPTQQIVAGHVSYPPGLTVQSNIMTAQTGKHSILKGEI
jgi:hypothetical protein